MSMTSKDYELIAQRINAMHTAWLSKVQTAGARAIRQSAQSLAEAFRKADPYFSEDRWLRAALGDHYVAVSGSVEPAADSDQGFYVLSTEGPRPLQSSLHTGQYL